MSTPSTARTSAKLLRRPSTRITGETAASALLTCLQRRQQRLEPVHDGEVDALARIRGLESGEALRLGRRQPVIRGGDPLVELDRFHLQPVVALARLDIALKAAAHGDRQEEGHVGT